MINKRLTKPVVVFFSLILTEVLIILLFPTLGSQTGALTLIPSLIIAWYWGPIIGIAGTLLVSSATSFYFYLMGMEIKDFMNSGVELQFRLFLA
jgi:hypothetical protein